LDNHGRATPRRGSRTSGQAREDLSILLDVPFIVEAEMGRTHRTVRDILKIAQGSLIDLDKEAANRSTCWSTVNWWLAERSSRSTVTTGSESRK